MPEQTSANYVEVELALEPGFARRFRTSGPARPRAPSFLSVIRRRSKKRQSVPIPTPTPFSASAALISMSVMSGAFSTGARRCADAGKCNEPREPSPKQLR